MVPVWATLWSIRMTFQFLCWWMASWANLTPMIKPVFDVFCRSWNLCALWLSSSGKRVPQHRPFPFSDGERAPARDARPADGPLTAEGPSRRRRLERLPAEVAGGTAFPAALLPSVLATAAMPVWVRDFSWEQTAEAVRLTVPLRAARRHGVFCTDRYLKVGAGGGPGGAARRRRRTPGNPLLPASRRWTRRRCSSKPRSSPPSTPSAAAPRSGMAASSSPCSRRKRPRGRPCGRRTVRTGLGRGASAAGGGPAHILPCSPWGRSLSPALDLSSRNGFFRERSKDAGNSRGGRPPSSRGGPSESSGEVCRETGTQQTCSGCHHQGKRPSSKEIKHP